MARSELRAVISANARQFNRVLGEVRRTAVRTAQTIGTIGLAVGAFSVKRMADFEKQMAEVNTIARLGQSDFEGLKKEVMDLSAEFGQSKEALTKGLYDALSAGIPAENGIEFLRGATKLATAGVTDTATAVDLLTSVLNAFGLGGAKAVASLDSVLDTLFKTVELGKTTIPELAEAVGKVAPQANLAGASMDETAGALAALTLSGLSTGEATTRLTRLFESFTTPSLKMQEAIEKLGFASGQAMIQEIGFAEAIRRTIGPVSKDAQKINELVNTKRAFAAASILAARDGEDLTRVLEGMGEKAGSTDRAFQTMASTTAFRMAQLQQQFDNIAITIGEALVGPLTEAVDKLSDFADSEEDVRAVAEAFTAIATIIVALSIAFSKLIGMMKEFTKELIDNPDIEKFLAKFGFQRDLLAQREQFAQPLTKAELARGSLNAPARGETFGEALIREQQEATGQRFGKVEQAGRQQTEIAERMYRIQQQMEERLRKQLPAEPDGGPQKG